MLFDAVCSYSRSDDIFIYPFQKWGDGSPTSGGSTPSEKIIACGINGNATEAWNIKEEYGVDFVDFLQSYAKGKEIAGKRKS